MGQTVTGNPLSAYSITHFTDENGLPQNSVKSITRDVRGNIWLATERGLARYDGNNFLIFDNFGRSYSNRNIASFHIAPGNAKDDFFAINDEKTFIRISGGKAVADSSFYINQLKAQPFSRSRAEGYLTDKKKYLASAHCIIEDKRGFFWVTTNKGLFQILKKDLVHYAEKPFGLILSRSNPSCQPDMSILKAYPPTIFRKTSHPTS